MKAIYPILIAAQITFVGCTNKVNPINGPSREPKPSGIPSPKITITEEEEKIKSSRLREFPKDIETAKKTVRFDIDALTRSLSHREQNEQFESSEDFSNALGFHNFGATCYANAALKLIWKMTHKPWANEIEFANLTKPNLIWPFFELRPNTRFAKTDLSEKGFVGQLNHLFESTEDLLEINKKHRSLDGKKGSSLKLTQQDANEFLVTILNAIRPNPLPNGLEVATRIKFYDGHNNPFRSEPKNDFFQLTIPTLDHVVEYTLPQVIELNRTEWRNGLKKIYLENGEEIDRNEIGHGLLTSYRFVSPNPARPHESIKPDHLIFSLNRFNFAQGAQKISRPVSIPLEFDLPIYKNKDLDLADPENQTVLNLKLSGIVVHKGLSANGGHYITYLRHTAPDGDTFWMEHDDQKITRMNYGDIAADVNQNGYIVLYSAQ